MTTTTTARLLVQILTTLGVAGTACSKQIVATDTATDAIKECPAAKGTAVWPDGNEPDVWKTGLQGVCLPKPANGKCASYTASCVGSHFHCGRGDGGGEVLDTLPAKESDACCWKVKGGCAVGRPFVVDGVARLAPLATGALDTSGVATNRPDLAHFAARTASEACIAETIAALQLHAAADAATDDTLAALLRATANEESVHALLGYRIVRWAIERGGESVRRVVADVFARASSHVGFGPLADDTLDLRAHGVLSRRERHDLAVAALGDVIAPAGEALAHSSSDSRGIPAAESAAVSGVLSKSPSHAISATTSAPFSTVTPALS